jgi:dipeptidyl aminopeptidase/acylaminoacyl peptidase
MKKSLYIAFLLLLAATLILAQQQKRAMTVEDLFKLKSLSNPQISPDGKYIVFVVRTPDFEENSYNADLWMISAQGGEPLRLTYHKKSDRYPRWRPDGKMLAFLSDRDEKNQIWLMSPSGGEAEKLTDAKSGVNSFAWSPNGKKIAYLSAEPLSDEEEKKKKEKDDAIVVDKDIKMTNLWIMDVESKKTVQLTKGDCNVDSFDWSADGRTIAYSITPTPKADDQAKSDLMIISVVDGVEPNILVKRPGTDTAPLWSPDGNYIAFISRDGQKNGTGNNYICMVPASGGKPINLTKQFDGSANMICWSGGAKKIYFEAGEGVLTHLYAVEIPDGKINQITDNHDHVVGSFSFNKDTSYMAFIKEDPYTPEEVYVSSVTSYNPKKLTDFNPWIKELQLGETETIQWKSKGGWEIEGLLVKPVGYQEGERYPTVVLAHGGPAGAYTKSFPASWARYDHIWAGKGYAVFLPNFRGSSNYGEKFLQGDFNDWGNGDYQDIQSGIDYLVKSGIADADKLGIAGWSYGGYMTAWTVTQSNRFKAASLGAGLTNLYSMYSQNDIPSVMDDYLGGAPWDRYEIYHKCSPMTYIKNAKTPTLILHGQEDRRVPPPQAKEFYMGLKKNGVIVEWVLYPREPHGLREPKHQKDKMNREIAWFDKYILGKEETKKEE